MSTYFLLDPFVLPYYFCRIIDVILTESNLLLHKITFVFQYERIQKKKCVDRYCLFRSSKFVLMKKCCQNIHIYTHTYIYACVCVCVCV